MKWRRVKPRYPMLLMKYSDYLGVTLPEKSPQKPPPPAPVAPAKDLVRVPCWECDGKGYLMEELDV